MTRSLAIPRRLLRPLAQNPLLLLVGALVLVAAVADRAVDSRSAGVPVPLPVYEIEAISGDHHATLAGLPIAPLGVVAVPTPVDVDGDLAPDVTVAVNLVDVAGLFGNPTDLGAILAPNLEINRLLPGLPVTPVNPPLRINMKMVVLDVGGTSAPTILRLGYDTGPGGSIPARFKVSASGLTGFFNPVRASVDAPGYEGPLTVVAGLEQGSERADADLRFSPLPTGLQFSYGSDAAGQHLGALHGGAVGNTAADREVDLNADVRVLDGAEVSTVAARVDRLPRSVEVAILPGGDDGGGFDYTASADGRLPDVRVDVAGHTSDAPLAARLDLEALPPELHADWSLPSDGPAHVRVEAPARPIGAVQARVANFVGAPTALPAYVPTAQQFLDLRQDAEETQRLVTGRVEGITLVDFTENERGLDAQFASAGGGQPLEIHASLGAVGEAERRLDATTTISPLPAELSASIRDAGDDEAVDPLTITYESSDSIDVDGHLEARDADVDPAEPCGAAGTLCTDLAVRDLPTRIETRIASFGGESRVEVDAIPRGGASEPDVFADVIFGQDDDVPLVAHAEALDIPAFMRVRAVDGADQTTARAEFHACDFDYSIDECAPGTEDPLGRLGFNLRNFLDRPAAFPLQVSEAPNHAVVTARGRPGEPDVVDFEAAGQLYDIREVRVIDGGGIGLRARVGGGEALQAMLDLAGVSLGEDDALVDVRGEATVAAVPDRLDLCFRGSESFPTGPVDAVFSPCVDEDPFGDGADLDVAPVSVAYRALNDNGDPANIDVTTELHLVEHADEPANDRRVDATLDIVDLPSEATAHVLVPDDGGPVRAVYDTGEGTGTEPTVITFSARVADGNLVCEDPRQPGLDEKVFCVAGTIDGLPGRATFDYDPTKATQNILLTTSGPIDLTGLSLSMVKGEENEDDELVTSAIVVNGHVLDFPARLSGTLHVPSDNEDGNTAIDFDATPSVGEIEATVQNFVGADPLPTAAPPQRAGLPPVGPNDDTVTLLQQGDLLRAHAFITNLTHAGYRDHVTGFVPSSTPGEEPEPVRTHVVEVGFSDTRPLRAYVNTDDGDKHVIADATVLDRPADLTLCFRSERETAVTVEVPTPCDEADGKKAAFALATTQHAAGEQLDINAFFRIAEQGGADILSGRADIQDLPRLLVGNLGDDGTVTVEALGPDGPDDGEELDPSSVGRIDFHVASFDITDDGYTVATRPFVSRTQGGGPFAELAAATPIGKQHLGFAAQEDLDIELRGLVGPPTPGAPGARFSRLDLDDAACATPAGREAEYPFYPPARPATDDLPLEYTCATVDLSPTSTLADPLAVSVVKDSDGERMAITGAELSDVPDHIQVTLAKTPEIVPATVDDTEPLRDPCGTANGQGNQDPACLPPLLRFDTDAPAGSVLSGVLRKGPVSLFDDLATITEPGAPDLPPLQATPSAPGWSDWGGEAARGLRAVVGAFPQFDGSEPTVVHAAFRLDVPDSVTVRPVQTWSRESNVTDDFSSAKDLRLGYSVRRDGQVLDLGRLAVLYRTASGDQIVLTDTAEAGLRENLGTEDFEPREFHPIPGELNLALYMRDDKAAGNRLIQVDGRVGHATDLRARVFSAPEPPAEDNGLPFETLLTEPPPHPLTVDASILNLPGAGDGQSADGTTFRLRAELNLPDKTRPGQEPEPPDECPGFFNVDSCVRTNIVLTDVSAVFDFQPADEFGNQGPPARLVKVYGQADGDSGLHIQAFRNVDAGATAVPDAVLSAQAALLLDPFNISYEGQFLIFNADVELDGSFQPVLLLDRVSDFRLRARSSNITGENVEHLGTEGMATIVPLMFLDDFDADVELDLWLFDVTVLGVDFVGEGLIQMDFEDCSASSKFFDVIGGLVDGVFYVIDDVLWDVLGVVDHDIGGISFGPGNGPRSALVVPKAENDPAFVLNVLGIPLIPDLGGAIMNLLDGILLCDEAPSDPFIDDHHPGDPLNIAGHPVPGAPLGEDPEPVDEQPVDEGPLTVAEGASATLCGRHRHSTVTIAGTLTVGGPSCAAEQVSQLLLEAESVTITPTGHLVLPEGGIFVAVHAENIVVDGEVKAIQGDIHLAASEVLQITPTGTVIADGSSPQVPINPDTGEVWTGDFAEDRSGGGHHSDGGDRGNGGDGGANYGNRSDRSPVTEAGGRGGPINGGRGGGYIELRANAIGVDGIVSANGAGGEGGDCSVPGDGGGGGGAGGGISIASNSAFVDGTKLSANGGPGASGSSTDLPGGGGGSGGIIKVFAPILSGPAISTPIGGAGGPGCQPEDPEADPGEAGGSGGGGLVRRVNTPQSRANLLTRTEDDGTVVDTFWHSPAEHSLDLHVAAGTSLPSGINDFNIVACATMRPIEFADTNRRGDDEPDGPPKATEFVMPDSNFEFGDPCGDRHECLVANCNDNNSAVIVGSTFVENTQVAVDEVISITNQALTAACADIRDEIWLTFDFSSDFPCAEAYWGAFTAIVVSDIPNNDCFDPDDAGEADDSDHCSLRETAPERPDVLFAVDITDPSVNPPTITGAHVVFPDSDDPTFLFTGDRELLLSLDAGDQPELSGFQRARCVELDASTGNAVGFDCHPGVQPFRLTTPTNGKKTLVVFYFDAAGNVTTTNTEIILDRTPPTGQAFVIPATPDGDNGWFRSVPEYLLAVVDDPDVTEHADGDTFTVPGSGAGNNPWRYRFDDGDEVDCGVVFACLINGDDGVPVIGEHTLHFTAVDAVGNRFDDVPFVPGFPDAHPSPMQTVGPILIDGVAPTSSLLTAPRTADGANGWFVTDPFVVLSAVDQAGASGIREVRYRVDGEVTEHVFDGPFQLGAGVHSVCWYAVDVAGNIEAEQCTDPLAPIKVDLADPVVTLTVNPAAPNGSAGWYTSEPTVDIDVTDAVPGSEVDPAALVVSVDGGPFVTFTTPITIPEGVHNVRAFAVDRAGRRSLVVEQELRVDLSLPVASARLVPPAPARGPWYRRVPTLVLRATDGEQNAGVARIEYRIDSGAFQTYTGPVDLSSGVHSITYRALDRAGRVGAETTIPFRVDNGTPTAQALQPNPLVWSKLLGPSNAKLNWTVGDDRSGVVRVTVLVVDVAGNTIRRLDGGTRTVTPGSTVTGFTNWDGRNNGGTAVLGIFHYRVVVTDEAGNRSQSGESRPLQIKLL